MPAIHQETIFGPALDQYVRVAVLEGGDVASIFQSSDPGANLRRGSCVRVPFGRRESFGYVVEADVPASDAGRVRRVTAKVAEAGLPTSVLDLMEWGARYYRCSLPAFIAGVVPTAVREEIESGQRLIVEVVAGSDDQLTRRQLKVLTALASAGAVPMASAVRLAGTTAATLRGLARAGRVLITSADRAESIRLTAVAERHQLTGEQEMAVAAIWASRGDPVWRPTLLHGVTGSGKTLVYMELAERILAAGKQVLILLPEIALTPQLAARFRARFGEHLAVIHSALADGERAAAWRRVRRGEARIVIGPRSALFAPLHDLGLIVVDEEHEASFKSESTPRFHARDLAVVYAHQLHIPVILGSATPSMESLHHARSGRYQYLQLQDRPAGARLPEVQVVDMRTVQRAAGGMSYLSPALVGAVDAAVRTGKQAIVMLNRRGWSPKVWCRACGEGVLCGSCDVGLTYHRQGLRQAHRLVCHACGDDQPMPSVCPFCGSPEFGATGIGTQMLEEALHQSLPSARILRLDADAARGRNGHADIIRRFAEGEADVLVGTQMVAKGLDLPRVTVVGVVGADHGLAMGDFRSAERTYQLVSQVSGRCGRGQDPGTVIVQAWNTDHPAIAAAVQHRGDIFWNSELRLRQEFRYPPFAALVRWIWSSPDQERLDQAVAIQAPALLEAAQQVGAVVLGPTRPDPGFVQGRHRVHALLKASTRRQAQNIIDAVHDRVRSVRLVACMVDVDPMHTV